MTEPAKAPPNDYCHPPDNLDVKVWRYMAVERFEALLEEGVFFARAHLFEDQREGSSTYLQAWSRRIPPIRVRSARTGVRTTLSDALAGSSRWNRQWVCVSCWHMNDTESDAMWKLYGGFGKNVCVQSSFRRLDEALHAHAPDAPYPLMGVVRYIDHARDIIPSDAMLAPYFHKPLEFAHEREVRAILWDYPIAEDEIPKRVKIEEVAKNNGIAFPILDLNRLIERVYVAPRSSPDLAARVRAAMDLDKVTAPLSRSSLETPAVY
jgi:hypothetical protein